MCEHVEETPRATGANYKSMDEEVTIKLAHARNCRILDNDDYSRWVFERQLRNKKLRTWLLKSQERLHMHYRFTFEGVDDGNNKKYTFEQLKFARRPLDSKLEHI